MTPSCNARQCTSFDALTHDLAAIDHSHGGILGKSMMFHDPHDYSDIDWLLDRFAALGDHDVLEARKSMAGFPQRRAPGSMPMSKWEARRRMAGINAIHNRIDSTMKELDTMQKSISRRATPRVNVGREIAKAREAVFAARERGEINLRTAQEADVRLRSFALNRLNRLRGR